jgi:hypothetical protein
MTNDTDNSGKVTKASGANVTSETLTAVSIGFDIHKLANQMVKEEWFGQSMDRADVAEDYIILAAANPDIANESPEAGLRFWRAAKFQHDLDKARKQFNRPAQKGTTRGRSTTNG